MLSAQNHEDNPLWSCTQTNHPRKWDIAFETAARRKKLEKFDWKPMVEPAEERLASLIRRVEEIRETYGHLGELRDGWNGPGSVGIRRETMADAMNLVTKVLTQPTLSLLSPRLSPLDDGSVDIYLESPRGKLIINVPWGRDAALEFSWQASESSTIIEGTIEESESMFLIRYWEGLFT